jgi:hypothetical protein
MDPMFISCRKATELMERRSLAPLSWGGRTRLWWHLRICKACRIAQDQQRLIEHLLEQRDLARPLPDSRALEERVLGAITGRDHGER